MREFRLVPKADLDKINPTNVKGLAPERQVKAIRMWTDQNIRKYGPAGTSNSNAEMQKFIEDTAQYFGIDTRGLSFQNALRMQVGWGDEWKTKIVGKTGAVINFDLYRDLNDATLQGVLKKIVEDRGAGHHGDTKLGGNNGNHLHWRSGSLRIFGTFNPNGTLTLIGIGRHTGGGNSSYKVDLLDGGSTTAQTA